MVICEMFKNCFKCDLVKLIWITLLISSVAPVPGVKRLLKEKILEEQVQRFRLQINLTLDYLKINHYCKSRESVPWVGVKTIPLEVALEKPSKALNAYLTTFRHLSIDRGCHTSVPKREEIERIILETKRTQVEMNLLLYNRRHKKTPYGNNLCKHALCSDLCMCVSKHIDDYQKFLRKLGEGGWKIKARIIKYNKKRRRSKKLRFSADFAA